MLFRDIVLALGALPVFAGIALSPFWLSQTGETPSEVRIPSPDTEGTKCS